MKAISLFTSMIRLARCPIVFYHSWEAMEAHFTEFKGLQILVHSTVGKIQQQKHAAMVLKNKTEIIKN